MDNTQYLKDLAAAEKRNKQIELEQAKATALKANEEEKTKALQTYDTQRKSTSVASQIGAKNFAEFLASRGQTNMGIAAQAEMIRTNALARDIGTINTNEAQTVTDYGNKATDINTSYQNNLTNVNNTIDQELNTNLYNERLRQQQEAAELLKARYSSRGGSGSGNGITKIANMPINYQRDITGVSSGDKVVYNLPDGNGGIVQATFNKGTNPFTGTVNKDIYIEKEDKLGKKTKVLSVFSNGYQPNNIKGKKLSAVGTIVYNGKNQNLWSPDNGKTKYVWDGTKNKYIKAE